MFKFNKQLTQKNENAKLPSNRRELFFDVLKNDFFLVMDLNLLQLLFSLPLIVTFVVMYVMLTSLSQVNFTNVFSVVFYIGLISVFCFALRYWGRGASYGVMKKRVHNEGCFVMTEFWRCFKSSGKCAFVGLFVGTSMWGAMLGCLYFGTMTGNSFAQGLGIGISILQFCVVECSAQHFCSANCYYELPFGANCKNSLSLALSNIFVSALYFVVCVCLPFALVMLSTLSAIITTAVYVLTLDALTVLFSTLYSHHLFDKYINKDNYPELVNKGLHKENK